MSNTFHQPSILDSFIEEVHSYLPEIEANLGILVREPHNVEALEETYRRTHTIAGSASMMNFPGLTHVAHSMEDMLGEALDGAIALDPSLLGCLERSLGRLQGLLQGIGEGIDEDTVIAADDADYAQYRREVNPPALLEMAPETPHHMVEIEEEEEGKSPVDISQSDEETHPLPTFVAPSALELLVSATRSSSSDSVSENAAEVQAWEKKSFSPWQDARSHLHTAIALIEKQQNDFKGFLDGPKDALDRIEEWAGRAMGLNIRNSPEHVRRYLPLSVMWIANSNMKQVLELLMQVTHAVEAANEVQSSSWTSEMRAELEQQIREDVRQELEIQVRQEFLSQVASGKIDVSSSRPSLVSPVPHFSNFIEQAQEATKALEVPLREEQPPLRSPATSAMSTSKDFGEEAAEIFRVEAEEHLQTISMHVAALEKSPDDHDLIQGIRRATHTLKGAAGMMGFRAIADLCHISEDLLNSVMLASMPVSSEAFSIILDTTEALDVLIHSRNTEHTTASLVQALRRRYVELLGEEHVTRSASEDDGDAEEETELDTLIATPSPSGNAQRTAHSDLSVHVPLQKIDELVNLFGELLVNKSVLEERMARLKGLVADTSISSVRLSDVGQKLESRFEAATLPSGHSVQMMPGESNQHVETSTREKNAQDRAELAHLNDFHELELDRYTEFHQLTRGLSEGISDTATLSTEMEAAIRECEGVFAREGRLSRTFQDHLMKTRLVPLSTIAPRLYRTARAVALKQGKEFEFLLEGEDTNVDRAVFEEIAGPLLHLIRNAVSHAIETPVLRQEKGKPAAGQIKLSAKYEGNRIVITIRDDGTGIDADHVHRAAVAQGLIQLDERLTESEVIDLIFRPGFSTTEVLSEESGRGVGLDVVRDSVTRLRGMLEVESIPGQGTAFTMKFPTSLAIQSALMVSMSGQQFAIPMVMIEAIGRLDNFKHTMQDGQQALVVQDTLYSVKTLAQFLSLPTKATDEKAPVLLVHNGHHHVAVIVDEVLGKMDVVMKNLGSHLRNVHGIAGGTILGNGHVVLVLELFELLATSPITAASEEGTSTISPQAQEIAEASSEHTPITTIVPNSPPQEAAKDILVVDDSPSVRRVVSTMLRQHGWEVRTARDGIEALDMISQETPAAVLLDIEMPRMDGYELMATIRSQEEYRTLPFIMLTSRAATKHQQHALQLGASSYVVKPYQDEVLIKTLNTLVAT